MTSLISYLVPGLVLLGLGYALGSFRSSKPAMAGVKLPAIAALSIIALIGFIHGTFAWLLAAVIATPLLLGILTGLVITSLRKGEDDCGCLDKKQDK